MPCRWLWPRKMTCGLRSRWPWRPGRRRRCAAPGPDSAGRSLIPRSTRYSPPLTCRRRAPRIQGEGLNQQRLQRLQPATASMNSSEKSIDFVYLSLRCVFKQPAYWEVADFPSYHFAQGPPKGKTEKEVFPYKQFWLEFSSFDEVLHVWTDTILSLICYLSLKICIYLNQNKKNI